MTKLHIEAVGPSVNLFAMAAEKQVRTRFWPLALPAIVIELALEEKETGKEELAAAKRKASGKKKDKNELHR